MENNLPVGLVSVSTGYAESRTQYAYTLHPDPAFVWTAETERTDFEIESLKTIRLPCP